MATSHRPPAQQLSSVELSAYLGVSLNMHPVAKPSSAPRPAAKERPIKVIARNPRARHDYEILHTYEAGIVLRGTEVKTLRQGRGSIVDGGLVGYWQTFYIIEKRTMRTRERIVKNLRPADQSGVRTGGNYLADVAP